MVLGWELAAMVPSIPSDSVAKRGTYPESVSARPQPEPPPLPLERPGKPSNDRWWDVFHQATVTRRALAKR